MRPIKIIPYFVLILFFIVSLYILFSSLSSKSIFISWQCAQRSLGRTIEGVGAVKETFIIIGQKARGKISDAPRAVYVSADEGQYFCACHATRRPLGRTMRRNATDLPPTRAAANSGVLHLSIRPVVRLANRGTAWPTRTPRRVLLVVDDIYVVSRRQRGPCEMLQSSLIPRWESPCRTVAFIPFRSPRGRRRRSRRLARVRHTHHGHVRGWRFFATISSEPRKRVRGRVCEHVALDLVQGDRPIARGDY